MQNEEIKILKLHFQRALNDLSSSLREKSGFVRDNLNKGQREDENDKSWSARMKRLQHESEHIQKAIEFMEISEKVVNTLDARLSIKQKLVDIFYSEQKEYMDKYYDVVCRLSGNELKLNK